MATQQAIVIRGDEASEDREMPTAGMERRTLIEHDDRWLGHVRTEPGLAGGWHHHGSRDSYVYVLRGSVAIEYGPAGTGRVEAEAGDLVFNPAGMVHREVTGPGEPAEFLVVRIGPGPLNVNVDGPVPS